MGETDVGDVAAVAVVLVAWCLERIRKQKARVHLNHHIVLSLVGREKTELISGTYCLFFYDYMRLCIQWEKYLNK